MVRMELSLSLAAQFRNSFSDEGGYQETDSQLFKKPQIIPKSSPKFQKTFICESVVRDTIYWPNAHSQMLKSIDGTSKTAFIISVCVSTVYSYGFLLNVMTVG